MLAFELLCCSLLGAPPPSLTPHVLGHSIANKMGHTRKLEDGEGRNMHADHHTRHNRNFGIFYAPLDLLFGTHTSKQQDEVPGFSVRVSRASRPRVGDVALLSFQPLPQPAQAS